jgi:hypothetical protein
MLHGFSHAEAGGASVHHVPGKSYRGGIGAEQVALVVVLINRFGPALTLAAEGVGVKKCAGQARAGLVIPDYFRKDKFACARSEGEGHGYIAGCRLEATALPTAAVSSGATAAPATS